MPSFFDFTDSKRSIYLFDAVFSYTSEKVIKDLLQLNSEGKEEINIFLNSPGGRVIDGMAIVDVMKAIDAPINTIVLGQASSMAALIAASGDKRFISESSEFMLHEAAIAGATMDTRDDKMFKAFKRLEEINNKLNKLYATATGKSFEEINELMATKSDSFMSAQEAINFGLADEILTSEQLGKIKLSEFKNIKLSEALDLQEIGDQPKRVHLLKACSLEDRGVKITQGTLESLVSNFNSNVRGQEISFDYTHDNDDGENKAGAWVKSLEIEGGNLFGMMEFTPAAKQMIKDKEYKYVSVEIDPLYNDEDGKMHSNVLLGGTFTNRPAVKGLDPIKLSENINNKNQIEMKLSEQAIQAFAEMEITGENIHSSFVALKASNEALIAEKAALEAGAIELKESTDKAITALAEVKEERNKDEKSSAIEALVKKGIIANSQKEKVMSKFSSKSEIVDFYDGAPAAISVGAKGSGVEDGKSIEDVKLEAQAKRIGRSIEDVKEYGLIK